MSDTMSVQILAQASENIQKLFDLSTRIDERVKAIQNQQAHVDERFEILTQQQVALMQRIAVLDATTNDPRVIERIKECESRLAEMEKNLTSLENEHGKHAERWKSVASFVVQLIWVILAAYLLTKLHLQAPAVP